MLRRKALGMAEARHARQSGRQSRRRPMVAGALADKESRVKSSTYGTIRGSLGLLALVATFQAGAAPGARTIVGSIGGAGNADIGAGCTTYGPPKAILDYFGSGLGVAVPGGGISACGYTGQVLDNSSTGAPVTNSTGVGPVILGNPGFSGYYTGSASATATLGALHAEAKGSFSSGLPGSPVALFDSAAAALFTDTLTLTSPLVVPASTGYVGYRFEIDGSLSASGTPAAYYFGETLASLVYQMDGGPVYEAAHFYTRRGEPGSATELGQPLSGWTSATGSISGAGSVNTLDVLSPFPIVFGTPWELTVGLAVHAYGESVADFGSTAKLVGIDVFDAQGKRITEFTLTSASGTAYIPGVPEPATGLLLLAGVAALAARRSASASHSRGEAPTFCANTRDSADALA